MTGENVPTMQNQSDNKKKFQHNAFIVWMTGLSGAGKTSLAKHLEEKLSSQGFICQVLDGDIMRSGLNKDLGFSDKDRYENIRRIAEVSKLFLNSGIICINSFITPTHEIRQMTRDIIGKENLIEVFVHAPLEICEGRDAKGLYKKARAGKIKEFTGIDSPFEEPLNPDIELRTDQLSIEEAVAKILDYILPRLD